MAGSDSPKRKAQAIGSKPTRHNRATKAPAKLDPEPPTQDQSEWFARELAQESYVPPGVLLSLRTPILQGDVDTCKAAALAYRLAHGEPAFIAPIDWNNVDCERLRRGIEKRGNDAHELAELDKMFPAKPTTSADHGADGRAGADQEPKKNKSMGTPGRKYKNKSLDDAVAEEWATGSYKDRFDMARRSQKLKPLLANEKTWANALRLSMNRVRRRRCTLRPR